MTRFAFEPRVFVPAWQRYGFAVAATATMTLIRLALNPLLGSEAPLLALVLAVVISAWYGGGGPGLLATALSATVGTYLFVAPAGGFAALSVANVTRVTIFLVEGVLVSALSGAMHTARARQETVTTALRTSERRFRATFEQAAVGMAHVGRDGRWLDVNDRLCAIVGYPREELIERTFQELTHADDLEIDLLLLERLLAGEIPHYTIEKRYVHRDGSLVWAALTVSLVRDAAGRPDYFISVVRDIGERKRAETEIRALNASLEQRVADRTAALEEAYESLDGFAAMAAHDLRAPLRGIEGFAEIVRADYAPQLDAAGQGYLRHIGEAAQDMDKLIQDLLAYSRLARADLPLGPVSLAAVVDTALAQIDGAAAGAAIAVERPLPTVVGHRGVLVQVVANLLTNGLKFTAPGARPKLRVYAERDGQWARLWVEDNGIGIDLAHQQRIFRPFERLHGRDSYPGTGIGLAIVSRAVARLGGRVGVTSVPGNGSRFWVELPLDQHSEDRT